MLAIIGTAGRDKTKPFSKGLWYQMLREANEYIKTNKVTELVSGGAAWADHLAVYLSVMHKIKLKLHLPAPLTSSGFTGPYKSAGSTANYYHEKFSRIIEENSLAQLYLATQMDFVDGTVQPETGDMSPFFKRNILVAKDATSVLAFTWGEGFAPENGGTKHTWNLINSDKKTHIPLAFL